MKITVIGTGYVGLVTAVCLADVGNQVLGLDLNADKIARLQQGESPIYEAGLDALLTRNLAAGRLSFTTDVQAAAVFGTVQFIAVGTPPDEDGTADLQYVLQAAQQIASHMPAARIIVDKSTVPVGTADAVRAQVAKTLAARGVDLPFHVVSNPEFLKEGAAIQDFMRPDRIIIGCDDAETIAVMRQLYAPFQRNHDRLMVMDVRSAELTKYAANAMLATRISFMNELANLAERLGADIEMVRQGMGADPRIGYHFLYPGVGYGGSCFPKDVQALQRTAQQQGVPLRILQAVEAVNGTQKRRLLEKVQARWGARLDGRRLAIWGLAFKPNTDDMREAPAIALIEGLVAAGAQVCAFDPVAMPNARSLLPIEVDYAPDALSACQDADALLIVTEWQAFRSPDFEALQQRLRAPIIFDGRNLYDPMWMRAQGFEYYAIGRVSS